MQQLDARLLPLDDFCERGWHPKALGDKLDNGAICRAVGSDRTDTDANRWTLGRLPYRRKGIARRTRSNPNAQVNPATRLCPDTPCRNQSPRPMAPGIRICSMIGTTR